MHPGDNYRAVATTSCLQSLCLSLEDLPAEPDVCSGHWSDYTASDMLTVWRKLHLDLDSMAAPEPSVLGLFHPNVVTAQLITVTGPHDGLAKLALSGVTANFDEEGHYGEGSLSSPAGWVSLARTDDEQGLVWRQWLPIDADDLGAGDAVYVAWQDDLSDFVGGFCQLYDDDWGALPRAGKVERLAPVMGWFPYSFVRKAAADSDEPVSTLETALKKAYITLEVPPLGHFSRQVVPFRANVEKNESRATYAHTRSFGEPSEHYWWAHATAIFQGWCEKDKDPSTENERQLGFTEENVGSFINLECCREKASWEADGAMAGYLDRAITVNLAHEVGHQFDLPHRDGKVGEHPTAILYIMAGKRELGNISWRNELEFSPKNTRRLRKDVKKMPAW
jgi:hypothetical protein